MNEQYVEFTPDGLFVVGYKGKNLVRRKIKKSRILSYLRMRCEIAEDTKLIDIFNTVENYQSLKKVISFYSWCSSINEFHVQAQEPTSNSATKIEYLEIYTHHCSYQQKLIDLEVDIGFHGIGKNMSYSVSCTPMYEIAHLPVKLKKEVVFWGLNKQKMDATTCYSLLEVLDAIYFDISFYGNPEQNQEFLEELKQRVDDINSGKANLIEWKLDESN